MQFAGVNTIRAVNCGCALDAELDCTHAEMADLVRQTREAKRCRTDPMLFDI